MGFLPLLCVFLTLFCCGHSQRSTNSKFDADTNVIWTIYTGKKNVAAFIPGDPFRPPRPYYTIPWDRSRKIPYGISYHFEKNMLVFSDLVSKTINIIDTNSSTWDTRKVFGGFGHVEHTAVDWMSDNLYWVDSYYEWIAMKPLSSTDVAEFKVIADANVISPRGICVDPNSGYMFWTDISEPPRIVRAELDGSNQKVIASQGLINPFDLTLDPQAGQIFWADRSRDTVETVMPDGSGRRVVFTSHQGQPVGVSYFKNHLFMADTNFDDVIIFDKDNSLGKTFFKLNQRRLGIARVITVWSKLNQPKINTSRIGLCQKKKCDQYCVVNLAGEAKCLCQQNYKLQESDGKCTKISNIPPHGLLFANGSHICAYNLSITQGGVPVRAECFVEGKSKMDLKNIAIDSKKSTIFFTSESKRAIQQLDAAKNQTSTLMGNIQGVAGLAFDYVTRDLYWSDVEGNKISSISLKTNATNTVVSNVQPGGLAIDPYDRLLFYINKGEKQSKIMKYDLKRKVSDTLSDFHAVDPRRVTFDDKNRILYWSDQGKLQYVSVTDTGGKTFPAVGTLNVRNEAIVSFGKYLLWASTENGTSLIHSYKPPDKTTYRRLRRTFPGNITDFAIFDPLRHAEIIDECYNDRGGCAHTCIPGNSSPKCQCNLGYNLGLDKKSCTTNTLTNNFAFASDVIAKRVVQVDLTVGTIAGTSIGEGALVSNVVVIGDTAYWADQTHRVIMKSNLDGTNPMGIMSTENLIVQRIAVDPATEHIYYTATNGLIGEIVVINKDGHRKRTLFESTEVKYIKDIKIHSKKGLMFWTERKDRPGIERATMEGKNRMLVYRATSANLPYGIEIDYQTDRIYWCDKRDGNIRSANLFGGNLKILLRDKDASLTDIVINGAYLYYTGTSQNGIVKVNKTDGTGAKLLVDSFMISQFHDLSVFSTTFPPPVNAKCSVNNGDCTSFCLPTGDFRIGVCECADGEIKIPNSGNCTGDASPANTTALPTARTTRAPTAKPTAGNPATSAPAPTTAAPTPNSTAANSSTPAATTEDNSAVTGGLGKQTALEEVNTAAIVVPIIVVLIIVAVVVILGVLFYRRRQKRTPLVNEPSNPRGAENPVYFNGITSTPA